MQTNKSVSSSKSRPKRGGLQIKSRPKSGGNRLFGNNSNTRDLLNIEILSFMLKMLNDNYKISIYLTKSIIDTNYNNLTNTISIGHIHNIEQFEYINNELYMTAQNLLFHSRYTFKIRDIQKVKIS